MPPSSRLRRATSPERGQCVDESGNPIGFTRRENGTPYNYYYITNLQGDVIQIVNANFNVVCNYYYDAWGAIRKITNGNGTDITNSTNQYSVAYLNPIRYRGYYYDVETGLYYLQTRYYDPEIGRFISRDSYEYIGATGDLGSYNLFAYCSNNPVKMVDSNGQFGWLLPIIIVPFVLLSSCSDEPDLEPLPYNTEEEAAIAFSEEYYSSSLYIRHEYGVNGYVVGPDLNLKRYDVIYNETRYIEQISPTGLVVQLSDMLSNAYRYSWEMHLSDDCSFGCKNIVWPTR